MERTQRRWSRRIYIRPAVATRPIPNSRPLPWSSASPRSSHRRWNHRRNEPSVITMGSERRSPDAASFSNFSLSLCSSPLSLSFSHSSSISFDIYGSYISDAFSQLSRYIYRFAKRLSDRRFRNGKPIPRSTRKDPIVLKIYTDLRFFLIFRVI